jgi:hypothetical protein
VINWKEKVTETVWFPPHDSHLIFKNITSNTNDKQTKIIFEVALRKGQSIDRSMFDSVLSYVNENGQRKGVVVPIEISGVITPQAKK